MSATPSNTRMLTEQRRKRILDIVQTREMVSVDELMGELGVSSMTLWRDLFQLDQAGMVRRVHGGVARIEKDTNNEPGYQTKQILNIDKKTSIAKYAVKHFIEDNDIIILEAGTTVGTMIKFFNCHNLTVITNGLANLENLSMCVPDVTVFSCGGMLRDVANTFVGPQAVDFFHGVRARTLFLSASGIALPDGITDPNPFEIEVKRAMAESAGQVIMLMDSSKFGIRSLSPILPLEKIKALITDKGAPESDLLRLREMGIEIHIVG